MEKHLRLSAPMKLQLLVSAIIILLIMMKWQILQKEKENIFLQKKKKKNRNLLTLTIKLKNWKKFSNKTPLQNGYLDFASLIFLYNLD